MKKKSILLLAVAIALVAASIVGIAACGKVSDGNYVIVAPDGAPALAVSGLAAQTFEYSETVSVRRKWWLPVKYPSLRRPPIWR